jgi:PAS domain S-box-containing protein
MTPNDTQTSPALTDDDLVRLGLAVLHDIPDAVIFCDQDSVIRYWNDGAARIFGFAAADAVGRSLDIIIPERLRQRHADGYRAMMATGRSQHRRDEMLSVPAMTREGTRLSIQFTVAPVTGPDGAIAGVVAVLRDATETFEELQRLRRQVAVAAG